LLHREILERIESCFNSYVGYITGAQCWHAQKAKIVELTYELAQRSVRDQLKSDQQNCSVRRHAGCGKLLGRPLGPIFELCSSVRETVVVFDVQQNY
jgi:hypothetical protein